MLEVKKLPANGGDIRDDVSLPRSERSPGERNNHSLQYSCLENPTDRGLHSIGLQRVGHDWSNLGWLQNNEETLICCGEACLVRAVPLQLYGCHKREHQLQSYTCPLLGVLAHNTERPILSLYCLSQTTRLCEKRSHLHLGQVRLLEDFTYFVTKEADIQSGEDSSPGGNASRREVCVGFLLTMLTSCQVSCHIWASSTSASSEGQSEVTRRGLHWLDNLTACGNHLDVLRYWYLGLTPRDSYLISLDAAWAQDF